MPPDEGGGQSRGSLVNEQYDDGPQANPGSRFYLHLLYNILWKDPQTSFNHLLPHYDITRKLGIYP